MSIPWYRSFPSTVTLGIRSFMRFRQRRNVLLPQPAGRAAAIRPLVEPATPPADRAVLRSTRRVGGRIGDLLLYGLTAAASAFTIVLVGLLAYKVFRQAWPAISEFGLGFVTARV